VAAVTTAVVDGPDNEQTQAWWFLDTLVVEHRCTPEMDTVVLEMTLPVGEARILLVHDNASFRDLIRGVGSPAMARTVPTHPTFPPMDELARIAGSHDLTPIGPPMSAEDSDQVIASR
jgi:hypothetical protein